MLVVVVLGCLLTSSVCRAQVYYVKPSQPPNTACPGEPCYTLNYYAQNAASLLSGRSNVTLLFVEGVYFLTERNFNISHTKDLRVSGIVSVQHSVYPLINLTQGWNFIEISNLELHHLMIVQSHFDSNDVTCDHSVGSTIKAILVKQFSQYDVHMTCCDLNLVMVSNVQLHFSVYSNTGIGLINYKSTSNLKMSDDNFNNSIVLSISNCSFTDSVVELDLVNYNMTDISFFNGTIRDCFNVKFSFLIIGEGLFFLEIKGCKNSELAGGVQGRIENFNQSASSLFELNIDSCSFYLPQMFSFTALGSRNRSIQITNSTIHNSLFSVLNFSIVQHFILPNVFH